jgi:hypothetical protein
MNLMIPLARSTHTEAAGISPIGELDICGTVAKMVTIKPQSKNNSPVTTKIQPNRILTVMMIPCFSLREDQVRLAEPCDG